MLYSIKKTTNINRTIFVKKCYRLFARENKLTGSCREMIKNAFICGRNLFLFWRYPTFLHTVFLSIYGIFIKSGKCPKYKSWCHQNKKIYWVKTGFIPTRFQLQNLQTFWDSSPLSNIECMDISHNVCLFEINWNKVF